MLARFPQAVPEIPVGNIDAGADYYVPPFRLGDGNRAPVVVWLNLISKQHRRAPSPLARCGAKILSEPEDKPWRLREFRVADLDGNQLHVFSDFSRDVRHQPD